MKILWHQSWSSLIKILWNQSRSSSASVIEFMAIASEFIHEDIIASLKKFYRSSQVVHEFQFHGVHLCKFYSISQRVHSINFMASVMEFIHEYLTASLKEFIQEYFIA